MRVFYDVLLQEELEEELATLLTLIILSFHLDLRQQTLAIY